MSVVVAYSLDHLLCFLIHTHRCLGLRCILHCIYPHNCPPKARPRACPSASWWFFFGQVGLSPDTRQGILENRSRLVGGGECSSPPHPHSLPSEGRTPFIPSFFVCLFQAIHHPQLWYSGSGLFSLRLFGGFAPPLIVFPWLGFFFFFPGCVTHVMVFVCRNLPDNTGTGEILAGWAARTLADQWALMKKGCADDLPPPPRRGRVNK